MDDVKTVFLRFKDEATILANLMGGYTTLELDLAHCVNAVRNDFDAVLKAMFRARGETQRIDIADALGRQLYHNLGLGTQFEMAIGAIRYCLKIRNQYAHCVWWDDYSGKLTFADLEEVTKGNNTLLKDFNSLTPLYVDVPLLQSQEAYFKYTDELLLWVNFEERYLAGESSIQRYAAPAQVTQPGLHTP